MVTERKPWVWLDSGKIRVGTYNINEGAMSRRRKSGNSFGGNQPKRVHPSKKCVDRVLDDWRQGLRILKEQFIRASADCPGLRSAGLFFLQHQPPSPEQKAWMLERVMAQQECIELSQCEDAIQLWFVSLFGEADQGFVDRYRTLARSAFGNLMIRPGDEFFPSVEEMKGERFALWTVALHKLAIDRPSANLDCYEKGFVTSNLTWEAMMMMGASSRSVRSRYNEGEPPDIVPHEDVPAHYSRLSQDVFLSSVMAIDYLLRAAEIVEETSPFPEPFPTPPGTVWSGIKIRFLDGHSVSVAVGTVRKSYHYTQMGMADRRNALPTEQWKLLEWFAHNRGYLTWGDSGAAQENQKRKERLSNLLQRFFGIVDPPFEVIEGGWKAKFQVEAK